MPFEPCASPVRHTAGPRIRFAAAEMTRKFQLAHLLRPRSEPRKRRQACSIGCISPAITLSPSAVLGWLLCLACAPFLPSRPHRLARDLRTLLGGQLACARLAAEPSH